MAVRTGGLVQVCLGVFFFSSTPERSTVVKLAPSDLKTLGIGVINSP